MGQIHVDDMSVSKIEKYAHLLMRCWVRNITIEKDNSHTLLQMTEYLLTTFRATNSSSGQNSRPDEELVARNVNKRSSLILEQSVRVPFLFLSM